MSEVIRLLQSIDRHLHNIERFLKTEKEETMSALDDLTAQVAANTTVEASAVALIQGIAKQLQDAIAAGNDSQQLETLAANMKSSADALAAAVSVNTPAAPVAPPPDAPPAAS